MTRIIMITLVLAAMLGGCTSNLGSASIVRGDFHGGEIALTGTYMLAAEEARLLMASYCEGRFAVRAPEGSAKRFIDTPNRDQTVAEFECVAPPPRLVAQRTVRVP